MSEFKNYDGLLLNTSLYIYISYRKNFFLTRVYLFTKVELIHYMYHVLVKGN